MVIKFPTLITATQVSVLLSGCSGGDNAALDAAVKNSYGRLTLAANDRVPAPHAKPEIVPAV